MANTNHTIAVLWGVTGLSATLNYTVYAADNSILVARTNTNVSEVPSDSGIYTATAVLWDDEMWVRVVWDDGAGNYAEEVFPAGSGGGLAVTDPVRTTYYLRKSGDDGDGGLSPSAALLTIAAVASLAIAGDKIIVGYGYPSLADASSWSVVDAGVFLSLASTYNEE